LKEIMDKNRKFNPQVADKARELIGEFFKERRIELGMSQQDLADCAGIRQHHLSRFENGLQNITIDKLIALGGCLRLKIFFEEGDENTVAGFEPLNNN
jgi:transcriptional regulator with XRE-family HTH domain